MASPSEFLTFYRTVVIRLSTRQLQTCTRTPLSIRTAPVFSAYPRHLSTKSKPKDKEHATTRAAKGDDLNVQTSSVKSGIDAKKNGSGGHATEQKDSAGGKAKAKKEFPEAPDVAIGMQDERGGKGA